jgi:hypothetical protein
MRVPLRLLAALLLAGAAARAEVNHAPGLAETADGALLACWYGGSAEAAPDVRILCARSADGGARWSASWIAVPPGERAAGGREAAKSLGNVVLHAEGMRVWMIHGEIQRWDVPPFGTLCRGWLCGRVDIRVSADGGTSWSAAARLDDQVGALPRGGLLHHPALGWLLPLYLEGEAVSYLRRIAFDGDAVETGAPLVIPGRGVIQPSLVLQRDGSVRAYLRDTAAVAVQTAVLDPATLRWSAPVATDLPNPHAAVEAFALADGRMVLLHNPSRRGRGALALAVTADGVRFAPGCALVPEGAEGEVAYPAVIRGRDGTWHAVYSSDGKRRIRHRRFDAAGLLGCLAGQSNGSTLESTILSER